jgi:hypothetical protein
MAIISSLSCQISAPIHVIHQLSLFISFPYASFQLSFMLYINSLSCQISASVHAVYQLSFSADLQLPFSAAYQFSFTSAFSPIHAIFQLSIIPDLGFYSRNLSAFYQASRQRLFMQFISSAVSQPSAPIHAVYSLLALPYAIHQLTLIQIFSFPKHASFQIFIASYQLSFMHFITSPLRQLSALCHIIYEVPLRSLPT